MPTFNLRALLAVSLIAICGSGPAFAQEVPEGRVAANSKSRGKQTVAKLLTPPDSEEPKELAAFIRRIRDFESQDPKQLEEFAEKAPAVIQATCEKILKVEKDPKSDAIRLANLNLIALQAEELYENEDAAKRKEILGSAVKFLESSGKPDGETAGLAFLLADILENATPREEAVTILPKIATFLVSADIPEVKAKGEELEGLQRRLLLPGNEMTLKGLTYGGKEFDLAKLKGKVVLVDFWATWCGYCVAEFPHMKDLYRKYRDRGFEIVGVNLDENKEDLDAFMSKHKLPWPVLYDEESSGEHPAAKQYGVTGLPTVMLVGADGKVISLDARGEMLEHHLKNLLGSAKEGKEDAAPALPDAKVPPPAPAVRPKK